MPTNRRSPWVWLGSSMGMVAAATLCGVVRGAAEERPGNSVVVMRQAPAPDETAGAARGARVPDLREPPVDAQPVGRGEIVIRPTGRKVRVVSVAGQEWRVTDKTLSTAPTVSTPTTATAPAAIPQRDVKGDGTEYTERSVRLPLGYDPGENYTGAYDAVLNLPLDYGGYAGGYYGGGILSYFGHGPGYGYGGRHYGYGGGVLGCGYGGGFGGGFHRPADVCRSTPLAGVGGHGGRSWSSGTTTARWVPR